MTNNPAKVQGLRAYGIQVERRVSVVVRPNAFSASYLEAKRVRMGHALPTAMTEEGAPALESASGDAE
jgi:GTP cyclohydrolase II